MKRASARALAGGWCLQAGANGILDTYFQHTIRWRTSEAWETEVGLSGAGGGPSDAKSSENIANLPHDRRWRPHGRCCAMPRLSAPVDRSS